MSETGQSFGEQAARFSLYVPFVVLGIGVCTFGNRGQAGVGMIVGVINLLLIAEFTPETRVLALSADFEAELRGLAWDAYFIKDYVKSLKTSLGSIIRDPAQIMAVVAEMEQFRGELEGGLCVRRVEPFEAETERRYFVLKGQPFSAAGARVPELVDIVAKRIPSPFFSVDVIRRADGVLRVVEVGDGQVSDLVGWSAEAFAAIWG